MSSVILTELENIARIYFTDEIIVAELLNKDKDLVMFEIVTKNIVH